MEIANIQLLGRIFTAIGWVFLPFLALPILALLFPKVSLLHRINFAVVDCIDRFSAALGEWVKWLLVALVLTVAFGVIGLSIFGQSNTKYDETATYFCALVILLGASSTLLAGQHVRVDIFYARKNEKGRALVDLIGFYALMIPFCLILLWNAQSFVALAWVSLEGSAESDGIRGIYLLKTSISVFAVMMLTQGMSIACRAVMCMTGQNAPPLPPHISPLFEAETIGEKSEEVGI